MKSKKPADFDPFVLFDDDYWFVTPDRELWNDLKKFFDGRKEVITDADQKQ